MEFTKKKTSNLCVKKMLLSLNGEKIIKNMRPNKNINLKFKKISI